MPPTSALVGPSATDAWTDGVIDLAIIISNSSASVSWVHRCTPRLVPLVPPQVSAPINQYLSAASEITPTQVSASCTRRRCHQFSPDAPDSQLAKCASHYLMHGEHTCVSLTASILRDLGGMDLHPTGTMSAALRVRRAAAEQPQKSTAVPTAS